MVVWRSVTWHIQPPAERPVRGTFRAASLPPPNLSGSAASKPRSTFNPLVLAYLGDAVWEAHTRRVEIELEARASQQQQKQGLLQGSARQGAGSAAPGRGRNGIRTAGRQPGGGRTRAGRQATNSQGASESNAAIVTAAPTASGAPTDVSVVISREDRKRWSTATFQALVFDALMNGGLPAPPPGFPSSADPPAAAAGFGVSLPPINNTPINDDTAITTMTVTTSATVPIGPTTLSAATAPCPVPLLGSSAPPHTAPHTAPPLVLSPEELDVLRWGRNAGVRSVPRDVAVGDYKKATGVEVLVAHLYLTAPARCAQLVTAAVAAPLLAPRPPGEPNQGGSPAAVK